MIRTNWRHGLLDCVHTNICLAPGLDNSRSSEVSNETMDPVHAIHPREYCVSILLRLRLQISHACCLPYILFHFSEPYATISSGRGRVQLTHGCNVGT